MEANKQLTCTSCLLHLYLPYNSKKPDGTLTIRQFLEHWRKVSGSRAHFEWVSEQFLLENEVVPYLQLPLWVPSEMVGFLRVNCQKVIAASLRFRPLTETIQNTLVWDATRPVDYTSHAGLTHEREQQLSRAWYQMQEYHS